MRLRRAVRRWSSTTATASRSSASTSPTERSGPHRAAPGGGVEDGEDDAAALARELREELGLELPGPLDGHVWERTHVFPMTRWDGQSERYYLLRVPSFEIAPQLDPAALAAEGVGEVRWWTPAELDAARDVRFAPRRLPSLLRALLDDGPPPAPLDAGI